MFLPRSGKNSQMNFISNFIHLFIASVFFCAFFSKSFLFAQNFRMEDDGTAVRTFSDDSGKIFSYNYGVIERKDIQDFRNCRCDYIHPLWGLDGEVLTEDFPRDHYHHHGIFWTWPHVEIDGVEYDLWMGKNIRQQFERFLACEVGDLLMLDVENSWKTGGYRDEKGEIRSREDGKTVMKERVRIRVSPVLKDCRFLDFDFYWTPTDRPVTLRGAEGKSYGGLTVRYAKGPKNALRILTSEGEAHEDLPEKPLTWVDVTRQSSEEKSDSWTGAAIFIPKSHPGVPAAAGNDGVSSENLTWPPTWLVRFYGPQCVGWPGVNGQTFYPGETIHLRYRLCVHRGALTCGELEAMYRKYLEGEEK